MSKGSGTRSGLLWEVERILLELKEKGELPQVLLMENVPDVIGNKNYADFMEWYSALEEMGYQSYYKILNAKNYGIPQNRERCFMVSILGKYSYQFPKGIKLKNRLKDVLEDRVDEKYYLSQKIIETFTRRNEKENGFHFDVNERDVAKTVTAGVYKTRMDDNYVKVCGDVGLGNNDMNNRVYDQEGIGPTINTMQGGNRQPKIAIKEATKQGYAEAEPGDSVNLEQPNSKTRRGRVGKGIAQTLTTSCNQGVLEPVGCQIRPKDRNYNKHGKQREDQVEIRPDNLSNALLTISQKNMIVEPQFRIRKLTPLECWRLMGFTDEDFKKAQQVNSNSQLYKQAGNSIVKQVLMAIFRQMI
nr:MAG TPA: Cytosine specific methyltransferase [Caudoviricetes sp.]